MFILGTKNLNLSIEIRRRLRGNMYQKVFLGKKIMVRGSRIFSICRV